ncbi:MAG: hypothetical protein ACREHF_02165 [Rhizomicrobium sp.]
MGPDSYSCWGLARACQRIAFDRDLPIVAHPLTLRALIRMIEDHSARDCWPEVERQRHGDLVTMSHAVHPHHIGTWLALDGGGILHSTKREGVTFVTPMQLKILGFRGFRFHTYRPSPRSSSEAQRSRSETPHQ